ncbi:hypothetical protein MTO98_27495 [Mucilaginibacter sp. SMC90]|uniref:hypothetical protein n=1 Tax=Mucilaginibacter sp. SMC90 TaxID=2929803 RepID=UPI001FB30F11|nr:hypothetical protein [Mucilaginibacter sp. SMC90]UOE48162.1 hypothetical protein MTO98_27495 [Mucilaginibacter sp. SMC90]
MKPDARQDELLKYYLRKVFIYRETYEEVYDHIISALQNKPGDYSFETAVNQIIHVDFGGHNRLISLERDCKKAMERDLRKKQFNYFISFFKFPAVIFVACFAWGLYQILNKELLSNHTIKWLFWGMTLLPYFVIPLRYYFTGYVFGDTKRSIRDSMMANLSMLPIRIFCAACALLVTGVINGIRFKPDVILVTAGMVLFAVYFLAFFKLSKEEFKVNMIN